MKKLKKVFNRQGKTESQMKASYLGAFVGFVGMLVLGIIYLLMKLLTCLLYTSPSPRDAHESRMPSSA